MYQDGSSKLIRRRDRYSEMFAPELDVLKMAGPNELEQYNNLYRVNIDKIWKGSAKKGKNGKKGQRDKEAPFEIVPSNEIPTELDMPHSYSMDAATD
jgi:hypothetical protein